jgi:hypothetical protein
LLVSIYLFDCSYFKVLLANDSYAEQKHNSDGKKLGRESGLRSGLTDATGKLVNQEADFVGQLVRVLLGGGLGVHANDVLGSGRPGVDFMKPFRPKFTDKF